MSASEIETSINWLGDDEVVSIFTNEGKIIRQCQRQGFTGVLYFEPDNVWKFTCPRDSFKFGIKFTRNVSDKDRAAASLRAREMGSKHVNVTQPESLHDYDRPHTDEQ